MSDTHAIPAQATQDGADASGPGEVTSTTTSRLAPLAEARGTAPAKAVTVLFMAR
jgi:hypothetical protein